MTFNNDLITETIKIYLGSGLLCVGSWSYLSPHLPGGPLAGSVLFLSVALSARAPWNFWIILHCLFEHARGWTRESFTATMWVRVGPHVRKEIIKKNKKKWRPAAKQNERCKKGEGDRQSRGLPFFSTYLSSARYDNKISCSRSRSHAASQLCVV